MKNKHFFLKMKTTISNIVRMMMMMMMMMIQVKLQ